MEAGCGEGHILKFLHECCPEAVLKGFDISENAIMQVKENCSQVAEAVIDDIYHIKDEDCRFELVVASEVLEHLEKPEEALQELIRVSAKYILISVPCEPLWRIMNMMRGKYICAFGNTPGHIQHWCGSSLRKLILKYEDQVSIEKIVKPLPWIMVLLKKK